MFTIHRGSLVNFLQDRCETKSQTDLNAGGDGLCILGGNIVRRNLRTEISRKGIPPNSVAKYSNIDDIAQRLLRAGNEEYVSQLSSGLVQRLLVKVLQEASSGQHGSELQNLADKIPLDDETINQLYEELNAYYRCTDAGQDHFDLIDVCADLDDRFARERSRENAKAFKQLTEILEQRVDSLEGNVYLSRSHLVQDARNYVRSEWTAEFPDVSWIAIATISVFDNPTLRLIFEIAKSANAPLHFFLGNGTIEYQQKRFESLGLRPDIADDGPEFSSEAGNTLFNGIDSSPHATHDDIEFIEAPDRRREVERVVREIREGISDGTDPSDLLVIARDAGIYQSIFEDIMETNDLPYFVETRRAVANTSVYRFIEATLRLIKEVDNNESLEYWELTDPLRLGFCHPSQRSWRWPVDDKAFLWLEQRMDSLEERHGEMTFSEWRSQIQDSGGYMDSWTTLNQFLDWIENQISAPPQDGEELRELLRPLLIQFIYQMVPEQSRSPDGPAVDTTRSRISKKHPTHVARRIKGKLPSVESYYERVIDLFEIEPGWPEAHAAVSDIVGSDSYGESNNDGQAIRLVDAGNSHFLEAEQVFILGLSAGEFPADLDRNSFLHDDLREAVFEASTEGDQPFFHIDTSSSQYNNELDLYQAALSASTDRITVLHHYKDAESRDIAWSPFVDQFPVEDLSERIRMDQWLPSQNELQNDAVEESWNDLSKRISTKDTLRLVLYHGNRQHPDQAPRLDKSDLGDLTKSLPQSEFSQVSPRFERFESPPHMISVDPDEPAFDDLQLEEIVGPPYHPHELDLFSQCEMKFYYYQFLFNFIGEDVQRSSIPIYFDPHYRFGRLPAIIRHHYVSDDYKEKWSQLIESDSLLRDRQNSLDRFDSLDQLEEWFTEQSEFSSYDKRTLLNNLKAEWKLVQQEQSHGIRRDWEWVPAQEVSVDGYQMALPGHRRDILPEDDGYTVPVFPVRHSSYARKALKSCYQGGDRVEKCSGICHNCGREDFCEYPSKYMLDHRVHTVTSADIDLAAIVFQESFNSGSDGRRGFVKDYGDHKTALREGLEGDPESNLESRNRGMWYHFEGQWKEDLKNHLERFAQIPEEGVTVDEDFVRRGGCDECVYRGLCQIPQQVNQS